MEGMSPDSQIRQRSRALSSLSSFSQDDDSTLPNYLESENESVTTDPLSDETRELLTVSAASPYPSVLSAGIGSTRPSPYVPPRRNSVSMSKKEAASHRRTQSEIGQGENGGETRGGVPGVPVEADPEGAIEAELGRLKIQLRERRLKTFSTRVALLIDGAIGSVIISPSERGASLSSTAVVAMGMTSRGLAESIFEPGCWDHDRVQAALVSFRDWYQHGLPISEVLIFEALLAWRFGFADDTPLSQEPEKGSAAFLLFHDVPAGLDAKIKACQGKSDELAYFLATSALLVHDVAMELDLLFTGGPRPAWSVTLEDALDAAAFSAFSLLVSHTNAELDPLLVAAFLDLPSPLEQASAAVQAAASLGLDTVPSLPKPEITPDSVFAVLDTLLASMAPWEPSVFAATKSAVISEVFKHINAVLCNELLLRGSHASVSGGLKLKMAVSQLEEWVVDVSLATDSDHIIHPRTRLLPLREIADMLIMPKDSLLSPQTREEVAPHFNSRQILALLRAFQPDSYDLDGVSDQTLAAIEASFEEPVSAGKGKGKGKRNGKGSKRMKLAIPDKIDPPLCDALHHSVLDELDVGDFDFPICFANQEGFDDFLPAKASC